MKITLKFYHYKKENIQLNTKYIMKNRKGGV